MYSKWLITDIRSSNPFQLFRTVSSISDSLWNHVLTGLYTVLVSKDSILFVNWKLAKWQIWTRLLTKYNHRKHFCDICLPKSMFKICNFWLVYEFKHLFWIPVPTTTTMMVPIPTTETTPRRITPAMQGNKIFFKSI